MFRRFRNLRPGTLAVNALVTLAYPLFKGLTAERNGLLVFTDAMSEERLARPAFHISKHGYKLILVDSAP